MTLKKPLFIMLNANCSATTIPHVMTTALGSQWWLALLTSLLSCRRPFVDQQSDANGGLLIEYRSTGLLVARL